MNPILAIRRCANRWCRPSVCLLLCFALAGCGSLVRLSYNNADWAVRYLANDYLDLSGDQSDLLRERVQRYHAWHRSSELPQYVELVEELSRRLRNGLSHADVVWASDALRGRYRLLLTKAIDDLTPIVNRLTPENLAALERKLAESNDKFRREYEIGDRARHRQERLKVLAKRYREWLGDLTSEQEARLERHVAESPDLFAELFEERKRRHAAVLAALRDAIVPPAAAHADRTLSGATCADASFQVTSNVANSGVPCALLPTREGSADSRARAAQAADRLKSLLVTYERHRAPSYQRVATDWEGRSLQLFLDIERSLSPKQRAHLLERLAYYAGEFRQLSMR